MAEMADKIGLTVSSDELKAIAADIRRTGQYMAAERERYAALSRKLTVKYFALHVVGWAIGCFVAGVAAHFLGWS